MARPTSGAAAPGHRSLGVVSAGRPSVLPVAGWIMHTPLAPSGAPRLPRRTGATCWRPLPPPPPHYAERLALELDRRASRRAGPSGREGRHRRGRGPRSATTGSRRTNEREGGTTAPWRQGRGIG